MQYDEYVSETLEYQSSRYDKLCQKDFIRHHPSPVYLVLFFSSTHVTSENETWRKILQAYKLIIMGHQFSNSTQSTPSSSANL